MLLLAALALAQIPVTHDADWIAPFLRGSRALEQGNARAALYLFGEAERHQPGRPQVAWQRACAAARLGNVDAAFLCLDECVAYGGGDAALLAWDPDLESLRGDPRFAAIAEELRERPSPEAWASELVTNVASYSTSLGPRAESVAVVRSLHALLLDRVSGELISALDRPGELAAAAAVSPDGRWAVVCGTQEASRAEYLRVHDGRTGRPIRDLEPVGWQSRIQFSSDARRMLVSAPRSPGAVWSTDDWARSKPFPRDAEQVTIAPTGDHVLLFVGGDAVLWDVESATEVARHVLRPSWTTLGFSADGSLAGFLEGSGSCLRVIDAWTGADVVRIGSTEERGEADRSSAASGSGLFEAATFLGTTGEIATIDSRPAIRVWNARTGALVREHSIDAEKGWHGLSFASASRAFVVTALRSDLRAFDAQTGVRLWWDDAPLSWQIAHSPEGRWIGYTNAPMLPTIRDARTGELVAQLDPLAFDRAPTIADRRADALWLGGADGSLRRIDTATGRTRAIWRHGRARIVELTQSADGVRIASLDSEGVMRVIDTDSGSVEATIVGKRTNDGRQGTSGIAFAPKGDALMVNSPVDGLRIFAAPDWKARCTLEVENLRWDRMFTRDGAHVLVAGQKGVLHVLDARTGKPSREPITMPGEIESIGLEPNGRVWIGNDASKVRVVDLATGATVREIDLQDLDSFDTVEIGTIRFRDDDELAVIASSGWGVVVAYDPADFRRVWSYEYYGGNPGALTSSFDPTGERVYVWGQGSWSPRVVDANSGATLVDMRGRFDALLPLATPERFAATSPDGVCGVRARDGRTLWTRTDCADDGWVLTTPGRWCDGTPESLARVHLALDDGSWPLDALATTLLDPKRVRAVADGVDVAPAPRPEIPRLVQHEPHERVVVLADAAPNGVCTYEAECERGVRGFEVVVDGRPRFEPGEAVDANRRRLSLEVPVASGAVSVRVRAIARDGTRSRAAHATFERR